MEKAKLAVSAETEIRTSRRLSGGPRVKVGGIEELRELFKRRRVGSHMSGFVSVEGFPVR
ncbi:hypothetical protein MESS2_430003 [Mesorhizobium metallidurans STM 2683]|uniref:Uncharacterized protein n=1 Tax=Mesorhizobium metallidurans STM 2683 TaxID=1297569 RepID=M5EQ72_9HYPH|nr:hypothetical protein MESS2_430003 [Mesorhizobium metallidurans STM 2683]